MGPSTIAENLPEAGGSGRLALLAMALVPLLLVMLALQLRLSGSLKQEQNTQVQGWQQQAQRLDAIEGLDAPTKAALVEWMQAQQSATQMALDHQRAQARLVLVMSGAMALAVLAFAGLALRQVARLRHRRGVLEQLTSNLRQARRDAEAASQAKSTFLANMSHEIRTPFHGLMGMLALLREAGLTPRQVDHLRTATESADHLLALLNDILDLSQLESGRLSLAPAPVSVRTLMHDVEALMRPQAGGKALALHLDAEPAVPERVLLDATRVKQVLFNLLSNAIKFSDHGVVVLDVRRGLAGDLQTLEFVVTDTGVGMDEATQAQLFSRFMTGDPKPSRRHGGSGLGLEISRNLARLMGGDISVRSKIGEGSRFCFWLPLREANDADRRTATLAPAGGGNPGPLRVLVAEDHPVNRRYLAALLDTLGHEARFTADGAEALRAAQSETYDLVLMDLHMPVLDGVAATRGIRALAERARSTVPIVALTADAYPATQERCIAAGMNDFLTKPVSPEDLAACLRRLFGTGTAAALAGTDDGTPAAGLPPAQSALVDAAALALTRRAIPMAPMQALVHSFFDQGPETVQRLRTAVRDAQPLELRVHAHAAKGAALNLGLTALAQTAQALQDGAAHLPAHEIARLVQQFEDQLPSTRLAVQRLLDSPPEAPA